MDAKLNADDVQPIRDIPNTDISDSIRAEVRTADDDPPWMPPVVKSDNSNRDRPNTENAAPRRVKLRSNGEESTST